MEKLRFSNNGEIFLEDFYFNADGGFLNKDDKSISLSEGMAFSNERSLIFNFQNYMVSLIKKFILKMHL